MQGFRIQLIALALVSGCSADECVPTPDVRDLVVRVPAVREPVQDVRDPVVHSVVARTTCITNVFDKHGDTFVQLASGTTRKVVGSTFTKTQQVAHRVRSIAATGSIHVHTDVSGDQLGVLATIVDSHESPLEAFRFEMPTAPAVGLDGRITSGSGDPCVMGIADTRSWRSKAGIVVSVRYSMSDLCDGRVPEICSTVVLPIPQSRD